MIIIGRFPVKSRPRAVAQRELWVEPQVRDREQALAAAKQWHAIAQPRADPGLLQQRLDRDVPVPVIGALAAAAKTDPQQRRQRRQIERPVRIPHQSQAPGAGPA